MADHTWPGATLVGAAQRGDVEALTALVYGSYPHVHRFAHTLCATPQDAEDAAQEALIILYRKIGMLRASGALASWMFRIVRNECLRRTRALLRRGPADEPGGPGASGRFDALDSFSAFDAFGGTARSAEEDVLLRLEAERVAAAVAALPEEQRQVLVMRDVQGLPGRTVADRLGLSTAAMKSRLHRARSAVREALRDDPAAGTRGTHDDA
ncbi:MULTISPECIES: RNA polymerase sigma factor [unclassified Streptomyces]|uniref:RNA polymerase sigma factor n=1 Tax=unclassified Streptomyces TaxID=2593676 RepID=UPI0022508E94|nr:MULTISPECIES: RNA polymerase sigma factor [unclassified Streptomyces]WTB61014.1 RNA polymerase sigma factor [Streptomyces sp. NBC_00826]WTH96155.1 RNA polymerase sigma factor [Streptomyces sp. NBC_00825]WTI04822.1 RNA polymerase sigma factor [Streptomyces sp. NBC_00822]MCX4870542.1 RNA polymerase sigma factor [Streptomyces sp. NBC_00906]MCX4901981.1 RNA polymerase sigma factor [Streptomyces sp. NBC_00892]